MHAAPTPRWRAVAAMTAGAGLLIGGLGCTSPMPRPEGAALHALAAGVHVHRGALEDWAPSNLGDVSNSGVVIGERCVAVIDSSGTARAGQRLHAAIRLTTAKPICYVINTHAHPDHVLGNQAFIDAARAEGQEAPVFVGHAKLPAALAVRGPYYLQALRRDFGAELAAGSALVAPTLLVQNDLVLDLGQRQLHLKAWPTAHTDADLSVFDPASGSLFLGDLLFVDHTPVVDGRLKGWLAALEQMQAWPVAVAVPGHGAPCLDWAVCLQPQQGYLRTLQADVRRAIKNGLTLSQAVATIAPDRRGWQLLDHFHARNVTAAYAELEWEE